METPAADDVPAGRYEVHPVPERWRGLRTVRIVGHDRVAALSEPAADHPVVAPDIASLAPALVSCQRIADQGEPRERRRVALVRRGHILGKEADSSTEGVVDAEDVLREERAIDGRVERDDRISRVEPGELLYFGRTELRHRASCR